MMMKLKLLYFLIALVLWGSNTLFAQNLDPTVEVRRDYEGKLLVVHKPVIDMAVPDSVYRFDLDFDYSVSDTPYKGAYDFTPYALDMKLAPESREVSKLYLKAGAGYQLHPTFDFLWTPEFKKPFTLDIYAGNRSYIGEFWSMTDPDTQSPEVLSVDSDINKPVWMGYDLSTKAGVSGRYDWSNVVFLFDAGINNNVQQDDGISFVKRLYNSANVRMGVMSKGADPHKKDYDLEVEYRFTDDYGFGAFGQRSHDLDMSLDLEEHLSDVRSMRLNALLYMTDNSGNLDVSAGGLELSPHYVIKTKRWLFDFGVRFASVFKTNSTATMYSYDEQIVYPDCRFEFAAIPNILRIYADLGGGCEMNTYSSMVAKNRRLNPLYGWKKWNVLDVTDKKLSAELGFDGNITSRFGYAIRGGYAVYGNAPLSVLYIPESINRYMPGIGYTSYSIAYAAFDFMFNKGPLRMDGSLSFEGITSVDDAFEQRAGFIYPANFRGNVSASYSINKRIFLGLDCDFSSYREGYAYIEKTQSSPLATAISIPGYADLGAEAEYRFNRKMSFWARGGNLLGMTIQRELLYAEKGPYFTAGICLNL